MHHRFIVAFVAGLATTPVLAADIYRWVDENGRTQMSDVVPERYRSRATRVDSRQFELSDAQRKEAAARAERERAAEAEARARRAQAPVDPAAASAPAGASAPTPRVQPNRGGSECDRLWQDYRESQECFAPYQRVQIGPSAEAFKRCKQVDNPSQKCGPSKWQPVVLP
jgi:hypothetical protein